MNAEETVKLKTGLTAKTNEYRSLLDTAHSYQQLFSMLNETHTDMSRPQIFSDAFLRALDNMDVSFVDAVRIFGVGALHESCEADKKVINHVCHHPARVGIEK